jgi:hypothetical protein
MRSIANYPSAAAERRDRFGSSIPTPGEVDQATVVQASMTLAENAAISEIMVGEAMAKTAARALR